MPECGGRMHEGSGVNERRDRAEVENIEYGRGSVVSCPWRDGDGRRGGG